uniref:Uncharacterized protein n=1 Tax=Ciona savignyi TaxID=51511 RepID=H2YEA5_CIOSA
MESNIINSTLREINCVIHWFQTWSRFQKEQFMADLVSKAMPNKVELLLGAINNMNVVDKPPNIFECQLRLFNQWFEQWSLNERNFMLERLESFDPVFVAEFYTQIQQTANVS